MAHTVPKQLTRWSHYSKAKQVVFKNWLNCQSHVPDLWARHVTSSRQSDQQSKKSNWRPYSVRVESTARYDEPISVVSWTNRRRREAEAWAAPKEGGGN